MKTLTKFLEKKFQNLIRQVLKYLHQKHLIQNILTKITPADTKQIQTPYACDETRKIQEILLRLILHFQHIQSLQTEFPGLDSLYKKQFKKQTHTM